jgi:GNAT superfamily N-acetyltransferase
MAVGRVEEATADEASVLAGLQLEFWNQVYADLLPAEVLRRDPAEHTVAWTERITAGGPVLIAYEGGTPVGFAALPDAPDPDGVAELEAIGVLPRYGRRGHGGRLLGTAARLLRNRFALTGSYWVPVADGITAAFLTRAGWTATGRTRSLSTGDGRLDQTEHAGTVDLVLV